jgi:hypothetical protein
MQVASCWDRSRYCHHHLPFHLLSSCLRCQRALLCEWIPLDREHKESLGQNKIDLVRMVKKLWVVKTAGEEATLPKVGGGPPLGRPKALAAELKTCSSLDHVTQKGVEEPWKHDLVPGLWAPLDDLRDCYSSVPRCWCRSLLQPRNARKTPSEHDEDDHVEGSLDCLLAEFEWRWVDLSDDSTQIMALQQSLLVLFNSPQQFPPSLRSRRILRSFSVPRLTSDRVSDGSL